MTSSRVVVEHKNSQTLLLLINHLLMTATINPAAIGSITVTILIIQVGEKMLLEQCGFAVRGYVAVSVRRVDCEMILSDVVVVVGGQEV